MKEKRIDMYLSMASLLHILIAGAAGTFVAELVAVNTRMIVVQATFSSMVLGLIFLGLLYIFIGKKTKKKKWKY